MEFERCCFDLSETACVSDDIKRDIGGLPQLFNRGKETFIIYLFLFFSCENTCYQLAVHYDSYSQLLQSIRINKWEKNDETKRKYSLSGCNSDAYNMHNQCVITWDCHSVGSVYKNWWFTDSAISFASFKSDPPSYGDWILVISNEACGVTIENVPNEHMNNRIKFWLRIIENLLIGMGNDKAMKVDKSPFE